MLPWWCWVIWGFRELNLTCEVFLYPHLAWIRENISTGESVASSLLTNIIAVLSKGLSQGLSQKLLKIVPVEALMNKLHGKKNVPVNHDKLIPFTGNITQSKLNSVVNI